MSLDLGERLADPYAVDPTESQQKYELTVPVIRGRGSRALAEGVLTRHGALLGVGTCGPARHSVTTLPLASSRVTRGCTMPPLGSPRPARASDQSGGSGQVGEVALDEGAVLGIGDRYRAGE